MLKGNASAVFKLLQYDDIDIHKKDQDELIPFANQMRKKKIRKIRQNIHRIGYEFKVYLAYYENYYRIILSTVYCGSFCYCFCDVFFRFLVTLYQLD